jgi:hypothetical protein
MLSLERLKIFLNRNSHQKKNEQVTKEFELEGEEIDSTKEWES